MYYYNLFTNDIDLAEFLAGTFYDLDIAVDFSTSSNSTDHKYVFSTNNSEVLKTLITTIRLYNQSTKISFKGRKIAISMARVLEVS